MRTIHRQIKVEILSEDELSDEEREILARAQSGRPKAQTPLSHYWVGAALLSENGHFYGGCNVERSTYSPTTHAEKNAIDSMIFGDGRGTKIKLFGIAAAPGHWVIPEGTRELLPRAFAVDDFCFACGECLQVIWDNCRGDPNVPLLVLTRDGLIARTTIGDAYPMRFGFESLGIDVREG